MGKYLAYQIILQKLEYNTVVKKYPKYKSEIDSILQKRNCHIDENGKCVANTTESSN